MFCHPDGVADSKEILGGTPSAREVDQRALHVFLYILRKRLIFCSLGRQNKMSEIREHGISDPFIREPCVFVVKETSLHVLSFLCPKCTNNM